MAKPAISVKDLGKLYRIGESIYTRHLREALVNLCTSPFRWLSRRSHDESETIFWALRNVSFEVQEGEVLGVIGRNGAGKSTLLKILSRITEPTEGEAIIRGRVGSLLEVGTGFHPDLTGRENIFLNGAILGMRKAEIRNQFDEIVAFSGVEAFLDTPVKRYSSGMRVRLGFAVAAHLNPEVLLVDEVLAVGDADFQRKCLGKMHDVARSGRTVLFVSHNMASLRNLCTRGLLLDHGRTLALLPIDEAVDRYLASSSVQTMAHGDLSQVPRPKGRLPVLRRIEFFDPAGKRISGVPTTAPLTLRIRYEHSTALRQPRFAIIVEDSAGVRVFATDTRFQVRRFPDLPASGSVECHFPRLNLAPGTYYITVGCAIGSTALDELERVCEFTIFDADVYGTGRLPKIRTIVLMDSHWRAAFPSAPGEQAAAGDG
jgi:homopolymeric O-antigen transport system ATP-binding protein